jgi:hypothetical protein
MAPIASLAFLGTATLQAWNASQHSTARHSTRHHNPAQHTTIQHRTAGAVGQNKACVDELCDSMVHCILEQQGVAGGVHPMYI